MSDPELTAVAAGAALGFFGAFFAPFFGAFFAPLAGEALTVAPVVPAGAFAASGAAARPKP